MLCVVVDECLLDFVYLFGSFEFFDCYDVVVFVFDCKLIVGVDWNFVLKYCVCIIGVLIVDLFWVGDV